MKNLPLIYFATILFSSMSAAQTTPTPSATTGIEGVISVSPAHGGPTRIDESNSRPLTNIAFTVQNESGTVTDFTTDDQGHFQVSLSPGHYKVSMKDRKGGIGRFGPFDVDVVAGQVTKVQWTCDSGMR
jgi:hypothetical protein